MARHGPASSRSHSWASSASIWRGIAFSRGWLSMVTTATWGPRGSTRISIGGSPPSARPELGHDDDLPQRLPAGQEADGVGAPLEGHAVGHARLEPSLGIPAEQLVHRPPELVGLVPAVVAKGA